MWAATPFIFASQYSSTTKEVIFQTVHATMKVLCLVALVMMISFCCSGNGSIADSEWSPETPAYAETTVSAVANSLTPFSPTKPSVSALNLPQISVAEDRGHRSAVILRKTPASLREQEPSVLLAGVGDMMLQDLPDNATEYLKPLLAEGDIRLGNLECAITNRGSPVPLKPFTFRAWGSERILLDMGISLVNLANNHVWDYQWEGVEDTFAALRSANITPIGFEYPPASADFIVEQKGIKIAFLGFAEDWLIWSRFWFDGTQGVNLVNPSKMVEAVSHIAAEGVDQIVVLLHWGTEGSNNAEPYQVDLAHQLVDAGATIIIGSHSHCPQEVELYRGALIAYSLGDCLFGRWDASDCGLFLEARLMKKGRVDLRKVIGLSLVGGVSMPTTLIKGEGIPIR